MGKLCLEAPLGWRDGGNQSYWLPHHFFPWRKILVTLCNFLLVKKESPDPSSSGGPAAHLFTGARDCNLTLYSFSFMCFILIEF